MGGCDAATFTDFLAAEKYLANGLPGRVLRSPEGIFIY